MKKWFCLLLVLMMPVAAMAAMDTEKLEAAEGAQVFLDENDVDTVIRLGTQPFFGSLEMEDTDLCGYLDFVVMPNQEDLVVLRLMLCVETQEPIRAETVILTVGKKSYRFDGLQCTGNEYDMTYYEDYTLGMGKEGLAMLKAFGEGKTNEIALSLDGRIDGRLTMDRKQVASIVSLARKLGYSRQDMEFIDLNWPQTRQ